MQRIFNHPGHAERRGPRPSSLLRPRVMAVTAAVIIATISGCASTPVPQDKLALAQASIERAERADAVELAGVPLRDARQKLEQARSAAEKKDGLLAGRLAEQADVDAQRAEAQAQAVKAERSVSDMQKSLQTLQEEAQRNSGATGVTR